MESEQFRECFVARTDTGRRDNRRPQDRLTPSYRHCKVRGSSFRGEAMHLVLSKSMLFACLGLMLVSERSFAQGGGITFPGCTPSSFGVALTAASNASQPTRPVF